MCQEMGLIIDLSKSGLVICPGLGMITCLCHSLQLPLVMAHTGYRVVSQSGLAVSRSVSG